MTEYKNSLTFPRGRDDNPNWNKYQPKTKPVDFQLKNFLQSGIAGKARKVQDFLLLQDKYRP